MEPHIINGEAHYPINHPIHNGGFKVEAPRRANGASSPHAGPAVKKPSIGSFGKLMDRQFEPIRYVVPGYVAEGATILAGRPKIGKSWLTLDIAVAVATGGTCMGGVQCDKGDVLYLALEDNERRLQSRGDRLIPAGAQWPHNLEYATEWPRASEGGLKFIREWIEEHADARLVIVDVLAMFRSTRGGKETPYESDYAAVKGLQALAMEFGVAIVIVHHTRKGGGDADAFEKVSGTLGLTGAADSALILDRDGNGCSLYGRGRDIPEIETAVEFNKDTCKWRILGKAADVRRTDERSEILDVLKDADEPMSPTDLSAATGTPSLNLRQLLFKMAKAGEVRKSGRGRYIHPDRTDLDNKSPPDNNDNKITTGSKDPPNPGNSAGPATSPSDGAITNAGNKITNGNDAGGDAHA